MMNLMRKFNMTCEDTSPLISQAMDRSLPLGARLRLKIHLAMCEMCGYYKNQLETLRNLARHLGREETVAMGEARLSVAARAKIQKSLDEAQK